MSSLVPAPLYTGYSRPHHLAEDELPVFLAELTGLHPTREGIIVQIVMLLVFAAGAAYVFAWQPARRRRRVLEAAPS